MIDGNLSAENEALEEYADIESFVDAHSLSDKYTCSIFMWDMDSGTWAFCDQYQAKVPPVREVVRLFGVGKFRWKFDRKEKDPVSGRKLPPLEYELSVKGPHWDELHREYRAQLQAEKLKKMRDRMEEQRQEQMYLGVGGPVANPDDMLLKSVGILKGIMPPPVQQDNTFMMAFMKQLADSNNAAQQNMQNFMAMMMQGSNNQSQMTMGIIQALMAKGNGDNPVMSTIMPLMNGMIGMVQKTLELKNDAAGEPEPDRLTTILEFGKEVLPAALQILGGVPKPMKKMVAETAINAKPENKAKFQSLKEDPELLAETLKVWDRDYGPHKIDELLESAGLKRPDSTFSHYEAWDKAQAATSAATASEAVVTAEAASEDAVRGPAQPVGDDVASVAET